MSNPDHNVGRSGGSIGTKTAITASTTDTQAAATQLNVGVNNVTVSAADTDAVKLPYAIKGRVVFVQNSDALQDIKIYPSTGDSINGGTVNAADTTALGQGVGRMYVAISDTDWLWLKLA